MKDTKGLNSKSTRRSEKEGMVSNKKMRRNEEVSSTSSEDGSKNSSIENPENNVEVLQDKFYAVY